MKYIKLLIIASIIVLSGCAATGSEHRATTYSASQLNQTQDVTAVNILTIMPIKVSIDNSKQKTQAQVGGGMAGAVIGGVAGSFLGDGLGAALGTAAGAGAGVAAGSLVDDTTEVEGVTLAYKIAGALKSSTQIGRMCEYKIGTAIMVKTDANVTRIQPNATCPVEK